MLREEEIAVLWKVHQRSELQEYFFRTKSDIKWFLPAKLLGCFSATNVPSPVEVDPGTYSIPQWVVLPYLKNISEQLGDMLAAQRDRYQDELLAIIHSVSTARRQALKDDADTLTLDNYRTWYFFIQILLFFPVEKISGETLSFFSIWLTSRFGATLPGSEIVKKLLPKILASVDPDGVRKGELIANAVTQLRWRPLSAEARYFGELEKPVLAVDDYWLLESFLTDSHALELGRRCSADFVFGIAERLHEVLRREKSHSLRLETDRQDQQLVLRITRPTRDALRCEVGPYAKGDEWAPIDWITFKPNIEFTVTGENSDDWFRRMTEVVEFKDWKAALARNHDRLKAFLPTLAEDYSYVWFPSLASIETPSADTAKETLTIILRELLLGKAGADAIGIQGILSELAGPRYAFPLFKRLALYIIGQRWASLSPLFWQLNTHLQNELFERPDFEDEMYHLLAANVGQLSPDEKARLGAIIGAGPTDLPDDEHREKRILLWKQKWYASLKGDPGFQAAFEECRKETGQTVEPRSVAPRVRVGPGPTPLTPEQILKMTSRELADFISSFEKKGRRSWGDPTPEALSLSIKGAALQDPNKFIADLSPFLTIGYRYVYELLFGIREALEKGPPIVDFEKLVDFLVAYTSRDQFWTNEPPNDDSDHLRATHEWVVGMIGELIAQYSRSELPLPTPLEAKLRGLLSTCVGRLSPTHDGDEVRDPVSRSLNSGAGKTLEALLKFSLKVARGNQDAGRTPLWVDDLRAQYDSALGRPILEAYEILGRHVASFWYLDKTWLMQKLEQYRTRDDHFWYALLVGYLHHPKVYSDLFAVMEPYYRRALDVVFQDDRSGEAFINHVAVCYLSSYPGQSLDNPDSLICLILQGGNTKRIERLIGFLWMKRVDSPRAQARAVVVEVKDGLAKPKVIEVGAEKETAPGVRIPDLDQKVLAVWSRLVRQYKDKKEKTDADRRILADAAKLTVFIPELNDENIGWLKLSAEQLGLGFGSSFVIEYLDRLKAVGDPAKNASYITDIFLSMLRSFTPDFREEHIRSLIEFALSHGDPGTTAKAEQICNTYAQRGRDEILRAVYEKHRQPRPS